MLHKVELATYVCIREADAFTRAFSSKTLTQQMYALDGALKIIRQAVRTVLGRDAHVIVAGSVAKGTTVLASDVDLLVESPQPLSLAQRQALEAHLVAHPATNEAHVKLKKLAIHMYLFGLDIDVVFASTIEHGTRPPANAQIAADPTVQLAARALKVWGRYAGGGERKVPGHQLEDLALHCRTASGAVPVGDGSMQLFVSVLQRLADGGTDQPELRAATRLDAKTRTALHLQAKAVLHVFAVSRVLLSHDPPGGFRTAAEVHAWAMGHAGVQPLCDTPAGWIPAWLLQNPEEQRAADPWFVEFKMETTVHSRPSLIFDDVNHHHAVRLMLDTPLGAYTTGGDGTRPHDILKEMRTLSRHAITGSAVAQRMMHSRMLWLEGEEAMRKTEYKEAVENLAASLRASVSDGDAFSGWYTADGRHEACASAVLAINPGNVDALLLRAWALWRDGRLADAEVILTLIINQYAPTDARGALSQRLTLYGNQSRWHEFLKDATRCAELCPEEPIFHYWIGVGRRNIPEFAVDGAAATVDTFRRFLAGASREGRKVSLAWYDIAVQELSLLKDRALTDIMQRVKDAARQAQLAEAVRLPVFPAEHSDVKRMVMMTLATVNIAEEPPASPDKLERLLAAMQFNCGSDDIEALHKRGNEAYIARDFNRAESAYSQALRVTPNDARLLSNRAATRVALRWFSAAAADAEAAASLRADWAKPYYRAAQAHLGRKDGVAATAAAQRAAELLPDDEGAASILDQAIRLRDAQRVARAPPDPREHADVWQRVAFKHNAHTVCASGGAAFASIGDALNQLRQTSSGAGDGVSLILLPGVHEEYTIILPPGEPVQLLGWSDPTEAAVAGQSISQLKLIDDNTKKNSHESCLFVALGEAAIVNGVGRSAGSVLLERLQLVQPVGVPRTMTGVCVSVGQGAEVRVVSCTARTPDSPCFAVTGGHLTLSQVSVKRSSAAVLVHGGKLEAEGCAFSSCVKLAVEVREGGEAWLRNCTFTKCKAQAVTLYRGGKRLELYACTFTDCGGPRKSVIGLETGVALLRGCHLTDNPSDAIIVQGNLATGMTTPIALIEDCCIERNQTGVGVFHGSGMMLRCTIASNMNNGCLIRSVVAGKLFSLRGNVFDKNGPTGARNDLLVAGRALLKQCVPVSAGNKLSAPPIIISDWEILQRELQAASS